MADEIEIKWLADSEDHDYPAAASYLSLLYPEPAAAKYVEQLHSAPMSSKFKAKDIFRRVRFVFVECPQFACAARPSR